MDALDQPGEVNRGAMEGVDACAAEKQPEQPASVQGHDTELDMAGAAEAPAAEDPQPDPQLDNYSSLWSQVRESGDFHSWTSLIATAEQLDDIQRLREAYDAFLTEYPLCFGYWKKYAEAEVRHGQPEQAAVVYERGVAAVPYSVDMWAHYCTYRLNAGAAQEEMEGLFERAAAYVSADYHAHGLWDRYLRYEHAISNTPAVAQLYTRILALPLRDLDRYHSEFLAYARDHTASELASAEEASEIRAELEAALRAALEAAAAKKLAAAAEAVAAEVAQPAEAHAANGLTDREPMEQIPGDQIPGADGERQQLQQHVKQEEGGGHAAAAEAAAEKGLAAEQPGDAAHPTAHAAAAADWDAEMADAHGAAAEAQPPSADSAAALEPVTASGRAACAAAPEGAEGAEAMDIEGSAGAAADASDREAASLVAGLVGAAVEQAIAAADGADAAATAAAAPVISIPDIADADIKRQWLARREAVYKLAKEELAKRQPFESALRRPFFHVKPLDPSQLSAWSKYLDYMEELGDDAATVRLYERCLVACANYPEFWMRYIRYLDGKGEGERAQDAFLRSTTLFCKRSPQLFLFAARRHELQGDGAGAEAARAAYAKVASELAPGMVQCTVQRANFERRQGDPPAACRAFEEHLAVAAADTLAAGSGGEGSGGSGGGGAAGSYAFLVIQYAHFLHAILGDAERAQRAYRDALVQAPHSKALWEGAVHLETVLRAEGYVGRVLALYERATAPPPPPPAPQPLMAGPQEAPADGGEEGAAIKQDEGSEGDGVAKAAPAASAEPAPSEADGAQPPTAAAAPAPAPKARGLTEREREELSERMVAFADLHGSAQDLRRAEALHCQRFNVSLALTGKKRGAEGGPAGQPGVKKAAAAGGGITAEEAAFVAAADAAAAAAAAPYNYYGAPGYGGYGSYAGYGGYSGYGYYGY